MEYETGISSDCSELRLARGDEIRSKDCKIGSRGVANYWICAWNYLLRANWSKGSDFALLPY